MEKVDYRKNMYLFTINLNGRFRNGSQLLQVYFITSSTLDILAKLRLLFRSLTQVICSSDLKPKMAGINFRLFMT